MWHKHLQNNNQNKSTFLIQKQVQVWQSFIIPQRLKKL